MSETLAAHDWLVREISNAFVTGAVCAEENPDLTPAEIEKAADTYALLTVNAAFEKAGVKTNG